MASDPELNWLRELRAWATLLKKGDDIKNIQNYAIAFENLKVTISGLNSEMKAFNETATKSNKFLSQIANLQKSMDAQARAANRFTMVVVVLAVLQVIIAVIPYIQG